MEVQEEEVRSALEKGHKLGQGLEEDSVKDPDAKSLRVWTREIAQNWSASHSWQCPSKQVSDRSPALCTVGVGRIPMGSCGTTVEASRFPFIKGGETRLRCMWSI